MQNVVREPNGRRSRRKMYVEQLTAAQVFENQRVVLEARARHTGLPAYKVALNEAGKPNAGTVHGIMCLRGDLSREQWDAAEWYIGKRQAWLRAIASPGQAVGALSGGGEFDEARHADWCAHARATWESVMACIQQASTETRSPIAAALDVFLVRDHHVEHMVGDLRVGLNAIHRRFLAGQRRAA